ncbi:tetratricopeptide repeat protein [Candidatus Omnitrophota bacterium]
MRPQYHSKKHIIPLTVLVFISIILFSNIFPNRFIWDDEEYIVENSYIRSFKHIPFLFTPRYWKSYNPAATRGQYRPVSTALFTLDYSLWKANPQGYHCINLLLHILNVILIYFFIFRLVGPDKNGEGGGGNAHWFKFFSVPFLTALLFASHPIHTEAVTWIKNRCDPLTLLFFLSSILLFIRYTSQHKTRPRVISYSAAFFCFILALLSKEMAIALPLVLVLYTVCFLPRKEYKRLTMSIVPFLGAVIVFLVFKVGALGMLTSAQSKPLPGLSSHFLAVVKTFGYYLYLLVLPLNLNAERFFSIPHSLFEPAVIASVIGAVFLLAIIIKTLKYSKVPAFAIVWILVTLLPAANIFFLASRPIAEDRLYIPSLGFCLLLGLGIRKLFSLESKALSPKIVKSLAVVTFLLILGFYSFTTVRRNFDWKDSLTFWLKADERSPNSSRVQNNLGKAYSDIGRDQEAISSYKKAIAIDPTFSIAYSNLGNEYYKTGKKEEAIDAYLLAIAIDPRYARVYNNLGVIYTGIGEKEEAIASYLLAIAIDPDYVEAYNNLAGVYNAIGKTQEAIALYNKAIELNPHYPQVYYNLGTVYSTIGKNQEAIAAYRKVAEIRPDYVEVYYILGNTYQKMGLYDEAIKQYGKALQLNPDSSETHHNLGNIYDTKGLYEEAIKEYREALRLEPRFAAAYNNLGYLYVKGGIRLDEGIGLIKKALSIDPGNAEAIDSLGWAYYKKGMLDEALEQLKKAVILLPDNAEVYEHLGEAYRCLGRHDEASESFQKALAIEPDNKAAKESLEELKEMGH